MTHWLRVQGYQGCLFTSAEFTQPLLVRGIRLSVDGQGRCLENVFVERSWRTMKHEEVYPKNYHSLVDARAQRENYFRFYNEHSPHRAHNGATPGSVYHACPPKTVNQ